VCTECWQTAYAFDAALALGVLDGAFARSVVLYKDAGERRLGPLLGALLGEMVSCEWAGWAQTVTWIPPNRAAIRKRGFDHAYALASSVGAAAGVDCRDLLTRASARDQRALGRSARALNARGTFAVMGTVPGRVLVVDDVLTTGATLDAAAAALHEAGAEEVRVAVIARAW
jgi:predicted amidophosphoribosyltransferase